MPKAAATNPSASEVWDTPWRLEWDDEKRCRFWSATLNGPRRDQEFVHRSARHLVSAVAHWLKPHSTAWTIADRSGALAEVLLEIGLRVSVDGSDCFDASAICRLLSPSPGFMGLCEKPKKETIDAVFWAHGIVQTPKGLLTQRLNEAARALSQDGVLILTAPNNEELEYGLGLCPECGCLFHQWQHVARYSPHSIRTFVSEAGFEILALQQLELAESAFRSRPQAGQEIATNPDMHLGSGETLVVIAKKATAFSPPRGTRIQRRPIAPRSREPQPIDWNPQSIAHFWDGISSTRLVELGFGSQSGKHLLRVLAPWLVRDQHHLDYGAGTGDLAATLIEAGYPTATFEPSPEMRRRQQERLQGCSGFLGVVDPESAAQFDTVLLCEVIEHILPEELDQVLSRLHRFLKPNGTVVVTTPNREDLSASTLDCPACDSSFHRWQHLRSFDSNALTELLGRFGFVMEVVHEVELTDAAFAASPYSDLLFRKPIPVHFGAGSTLVFVGRKTSSPREPLAEQRKTVPSEQEHKLPASPMAQVTAHILDKIAADRGSGQACATLVFLKQLAVADYLELLREPRVGSALFSEAVAPRILLEAGQAAIVDPRTGLLPNDFVIARDLIVVGSPMSLGRRMIWALIRNGAKRAWFVGAEPSPRAMNTLGALTAWRLMLASPRQVFALVRTTQRHTARRLMLFARALARKFIPAPLQERLGRAIAAGRDRRAERELQLRLADVTPLHQFRPLLPETDFDDGPVILVNNALAWGGVERQVVYVASGMAQALDRPVALLCLRLHAGDDYQFYLPHLEDEPVEVRDVNDEDWAQRNLETQLPAARLDEVEFTISPFPDDIRAEIRRFLAEFISKRPAVVHAWQDSASIAAGYAAVLAGVPRVILSSRNMRPTNFAYYRGFMLEGYRALSRVSKLILVNNSKAGATDYANWIGLPASRFIVKRNGIDPAVFHRASVTDISSLRATLDIPAGVPLVGSVFRLYDEKRPLLWIETAAIVAHHPSQPHFVVFGTGPRAKAARALANQLGIGDRLHLPGTVNDAKLAISSMDVFLLTSSFEGTPNVLLEAQLLGVPVVATDAGGTAEALESGVTGWLVSEPQPQILADRVLAVLNDPIWRSQVRTSGPRFVSSRFGLKRMIDETLDLYGIPEHASMSAQPSCQ